MPKIALIIGALILGIAGFSLLSKGSGGKHDTNFHLPSNVREFKGDGGDSQINFQTNLSLDDLLAFYREKYTQEGLVERTLVTVQSDSTLNLVFDGHESGKALVIQAVTLPYSTNVNVRLE